MSLNYAKIYANGLNSNSQIRRSTDFAYSRGGTFEVIITGDTFVKTIELDVDIYVDDEKVGRIAVVPYSLTEQNQIYTYKFYIRPYSYISNFLKSEHNNYLWQYDWYSTNQDINVNRQYNNIVKWNMKYGWRYLINGVTTKEYTSEPQNDFNHYTMIPICANAIDYNASGYTNTGQYFNLIGGIFQIDEKYIMRNFDQEVGSTIDDNNNIYTLDINRRLSPICQFIMDYPTTPEDSETSRFLTDAPRIQNVRLNETLNLYMLNGLTGDRQFIEGNMIFLEFFDANNNRINYAYNNLTYSDPVDYTPTLTITAIPVGPADIIATFETIDFTDVAYYKVQAVYGDVQPLYPVSEVFYFYITDKCSKDETRLVWLNARGGYDYYTFTNYREDSKKIERLTFDNRYYSSNIQSPDRDVARTIKTFDININKEFVLESDYLTVEDGNWLEQLFTSTQVYEIKDDFISPIDRQDKVYKDLRPVQVLSTDVTKITKNHQKLNKYRITLQYATTYFAQKGF